MATKSFLKNIDIKSKKEKRTFANSLYNAYNKKDIKADLSRPVKFLNSNDIKKYFGE